MSLLKIIEYLTLTEIGKENLPASWLIGGIQFNLKMETQLTPIIIKYFYYSF